jgi:hypothetical protein
VRHLAAVADLAGLDLDVGPCLAAAAEDGPGAQVGERTDAGVRSDDRSLRVRADDAGSGADLASRSVLSGPTTAPAATVVRPVQLRPGVQDDVGLELDVDVEPGGRGSTTVTPARCALDQPVVEQPPRLRQLHAVVDAHRLVGVAREVRRTTRPGGVVQARGRR